MSSGYLKLKVALYFILIPIIFTDGYLLFRLVSGMSHPVATMIGFFGGLTVSLAIICLLLVDYCSDQNVSQETPPRETYHLCDGNRCDYGQDLYSIQRQVYNF